ncbi:MAG: hypothetical protein H3C68_04735 [Deltaproteobacteria bacterium]|nr:hypothetical protein [Deltaproteobacteria bacterium]MBZ0220033.1 hypothetical protein [Deltaproteobacteria bacterium]
MALFLSGAALPAPSEAAGINWLKIKPVKIALFYPGVVSWEFLVGEDHRLGARMIKSGRKDCRNCHLAKDGTLDIKADEIASGSLKMKRSLKPFEPEPSAGKKGFISADMQAAYDREHLYLRFRWSSTGAGWAQSANIPDRISIQANKSDQLFRAGGCFITCHNDLSTMPHAPSRKEMGEHPAYRGKDEVSLYSVHAKASWDKKNSDAEARKAAGLIDLKSIELGKGLARAADGWIYDEKAWEERPGFEGMGEWSEGAYTAVFKRPIGSAGKNDVALSEGDVFTIAVAIHEDGAKERRHYVSLPVSIGLGSGGDIQAIRLKD